MFFILFYQMHNQDLSLLKRLARQLLAEFQLREFIFCWTYNFGILISQGIKVNPKKGSVNVVTDHYVFSFNIWHLFRPGKNC